MLADNLTSMGRSLILHNDELEKELPFWKNLNLEFRCQVPGVYTYVFNIKNTFFHVFLIFPVIFTFSFGVSDTLLLFSVSSCCSSLVCPSFISSFNLSCSCSNSLDPSFRNRSICLYVYQKYNKKKLKHQLFQLDE